MLLAEDLPIPLASSADVSDADLEALRRFGGSPAPKARGYPQSAPRRLFQRATTGLLTPPWQRGPPAPSPTPLNPFKETSLD